MPFPIFQIPLLMPPYGEKFEGGYLIERNPITGGSRLICPPKGKFKQMQPFSEKNFLEKGGGRTVRAKAEVEETVDQSSSRGQQQGNNNQQSSNKSQLSSNQQQQSNSKGAKGKVSDEVNLLLSISTAGQLERSEGKDVWPQHVCRRRSREGGCESFVRIQRSQGRRSCWCERFKERRGEGKRKSHQLAAFSRAELNFSSQDEAESERSRKSQERKARFYQLHTIC